MIQATVVADSVVPGWTRLTTVEVRIHRFVLAELNTHRMFSRNSASSRAIPIQKQIDRILGDCAFPVEFGSNQPGMQAGPPLTGRKLKRAKKQWAKASRDAVRRVKKLQKLGVHKQVANRILEPFMWHTVIITATDWQNFFDQRCHPDAQPEIRVAAEAIRAAMEASTPRALGPDDYHLPYIQDDEHDLPLWKRIKISVARCARVSYLTHGGVRDIEKDFELFAKLATANPPHWSPMEHVARPGGYGDSIGNFKGWIQVRHDLDQLAYLEGTNQ